MVTQATFVWESPGAKELNSWSSQINVNNYNVFLILVDFTVIPAYVALKAKSAYEPSGPSGLRLSPVSVA